VSIRAPSWIRWAPNRSSARRHALPAARHRHSDRVHVPSSVTRRCTVWSTRCARAQCPAISKRCSKGPRSRWPGFPARMRKWMCGRRCRAGSALRRGRQDRGARAQALDFLCAAAAEDRLQPGCASDRGDGDGGSGGSAAIQRAREVLAPPPAGPERMTRRASALVLGLWLAAAAPRSGATGAATPLDHFLDGLTSLRTHFTQVVVDAGGKALERGTGTLLVRRPGRFRWEYQPSDAGARLLVPMASISGSMIMSCSRRLSSRPRPR